MTAHAAFYSAVQQEYGDIQTITRQQILHLEAKYGIGDQSWIRNNLAHRAGRGVYSLHPMTAKDKAAVVAQAQAYKVGAFQPESQETDEEIFTRISDRFEVMTDMARATAEGINRALIISGPPGLGKSHGIFQILNKLEQDGEVISHVVKGFVRPTGLYKTLYEYRHKNCVVVFDDADSTFLDADSLNLLKSACDTTKARHISWLAETKMEDEGGERIPRSFEFEGSIIFITNYDFDAAIGKGHKLAPHFEAMISRSHYLDLTLKSRRDYVIRIKQVVDQGMLKEHGLSKAQEANVMDYLLKNVDKLRELSLRMVIKLANLALMRKDGWQKIANATCLR